jgi:transposase
MQHGRPPKVDEAKLNQIALLSETYSPTEVAAMVGVSTRTVERYLSQIRKMQGSDAADRTANDSGGQ